MKVSGRGHLGGARAGPRAGRPERPRRAGRVAPGVGLVAAGLAVPATRWLFADDRAGEGELAEDVGCGGLLATTGTAAIVAAAIVVGVALFATGATVGVLTGGSLLRRGLRQLGIGVAAAVVTYWPGRLFGTTIG